jgi:hypothetical protein
MAKAKKAPTHVSQGEQLISTLTYLAASNGVNQEDAVKKASNAAARYVRKLEKELIERGGAVRLVKVKVVDVDAGVGT